MNQTTATRTAIVAVSTPTPAFTSEDAERHFKYMANYVREQLESFLASEQQKLESGDLSFNFIGRINKVSDCIAAQ